MFDADVPFKLIVGMNLAMTVIHWFRTIFLMPVQKVDPKSPPFYTSPYYKWIRNKKQNSIQTDQPVIQTEVVEIDPRLSIATESLVVPKTNGQPRLYLWS